MNGQQKVCVGSKAFIHNQNKMSHHLPVLQRKEPPTSNADSLKEPVNHLKHFEIFFLSTQTLQENQFGFSQIKQSQRKG
jgi:hypothetical protein